MSSSLPQKTDSSGPSMDGHPQGPLGGAGQGERPQSPAVTLCAVSALPPWSSMALSSLPAPQTPAATLCAVSARPPQSSMALPSLSVPQTPAATLSAVSALPPQSPMALPWLPVSGTRTCLTSSLPVVPVSQPPAAVPFYGGPACPLVSLHAFPRPGNAVACAGRCLNHPLSTDLPQGLCSPHLPVLPPFPVLLLVASRFPDRLLAWACICSSLLPVRPPLAAPH